MTPAWPARSPTKLFDEPGLAHAGRAEHGEQLAGAVADSLVEGVAQPSALTLAADHDRGRTPLDGNGAGKFEDAPSIAYGLGDNAVSHESLRRDVRRDLAWPGRVTKAG